MSRSALVTVLFFSLFGILRHYCVFFSVDLLCSSQNKMLCTNVMFIVYNLLTSGGHFHGLAIDY